MNKLMCLVSGISIIRTIHRVKLLFLRQASTFLKYDKSIKKLAVKTNRIGKVTKYTFISIAIIGGAYLCENSAKRNALIDAGFKLFELNPNSEIPSFSSRCNDLFQILSQVSTDVFDWANFKIQALYLTGILLPIVYIPAIMLLVRKRTSIPSILFPLTCMPAFVWLVKQIHTIVMTFNKDCSTNWENHQRVKRICEELKEKNHDCPGIKDITFEVVADGLYHSKLHDKHLAVSSAGAVLSENKIVIAKRILGFQQCDDLIAFVVAHEMGHLVLNKILRDTMQGCGCSANIRFDLVNNTHRSHMDSDDFLGTYSKDSKNSVVMKFLQDSRKIEYIADSIGKLLISNTSFDVKKGANLFFARAELIFIRRNLLYPFCVLLMTNYISVLKVFIIMLVLLKIKILFC